MYISCFNIHVMSYNIWYVYKIYKKGPFPVQFSEISSYLAKNKSDCFVK